MFNRISAENKKRLTLLFRTVVSALIIFYLFRSANLVETIRSVLRTDQRVWIPALALYLLGQAVCAYKWKGIAGIAGFRGPFRDYFSFYFIGMFFNLFLPSTIGGDVVKCYYLAKEDFTGRAAPAIYTVLIERFTGLAVLVWILALALFLPGAWTIPLALKFGMLVAALLMTVVTPFAPFLGRLLFSRFSWARTMIQDIEIYWQRPRAMAIALWWSLVFHLLFITVHVLIGMAVGIPVPIAYYFIVYPAATLAGFLPIALNGIGPREGTYLYLFGLVGAARPDAMAFGILWLGVMVFGNLTGVFFYVKRGDVRSEK